MSSVCIAVSRQKATPQGLMEALGDPTWEWTHSKADSAIPCGLAPGDVQTAGWGDASACCRIYIHADGFCIAAPLDVKKDRAYAAQVAAKLGMAPVVDEGKAVSRNKEV